MLARALLAATLLLCFAVDAQERAQSIYLSMKFERDGAEISSARVLVESAQQAEVRVDDRLKVELTATGSSTNVDLRMNVYGAEASGLALVGSPRLIVNYGQESQVSWSKNGAAYRITVTPRLYDRPANV
jgi:hypothetical protein